MDSLWVFLAIKGVEPTNNDLHIRHTRIPRRISRRNPHGIVAPAPVFRPLGPELQGDIALRP